jgi:death-on-curing protein
MIPTFLTVTDVLRQHDRTLREDGGAAGVRDPGALESAVLAAETRYHYEDADVPTCAATYAFHLCSAHAFVDGNKRAGAAASLVFLELNGMKLRASKAETTTLFQTIAAGGMTRDEVEAWFRRRAKPR